MNPTSIAAAALLMIVAGCSEPSSSSPEPAAKGASAGPVKAAPTSTDTSISQAPPPVGASASADVASPRLALDPDGLRWFLQPSGASRALPFGMAQTEVLASLEKERSLAARGTNADCGAGPVEFAGWPDGLSLLFQDGRFVGWGLDNRAKRGVRTADGIGVGSTRAELDDAMGPPLQVRKTTLGTEFSVEEYNGLFENGRPEARITDMWAGVSCVAR